MTSHGKVAICESRLKIGPVIKSRESNTPEWSEIGGSSGRDTANKGYRTWDDGTRHKFVNRATEGQVFQNTCVLDHTVVPP